MTQSVKKRFWGFNIKISLTDNKLLTETATAMVCHSDRTFEVVFRGLVSLEQIVHESWHLFMDILDVAEIEPKPYCELSAEAYAYSFQELVVLLKESITSMSLYKKLWETHNKHDN